MRNKQAHAILIFILIALIGVLLTACNSSPSTTSTNTPSGTLPVDPLFKEYYQDMGSESILGPAITNAFEDNNQTCQYFANALVCYNPDRDGANRFHLVSIGNQFNISKQAGYVASSENATIVNGFEIYPDFLDLYTHLNELNAVGQPISNPMYDFEKERVEQYFEKVGFVYQFDSTEKSVQLLPYGAYACDYQCRDYHYTPFSPNRKAPDMPFLVPFERLGGVQIFGQPISDSYIAPDGNREQIFENVVIFAPPDNLNYIQFRPLAKILGMIAVSPGEMKYGLQDNVVFYPTQDGLGYHVPIIFDQFIAQHGGTEISGIPIADVMRYREDDINRQCYTNYCLEYHQEATESLRIRLTPLGTRYKNMLEEQGQYPFNTGTPEPQEQSETVSPEENSEFPIPDTGVLESAEQDQAAPQLESQTAEEPAATEDSSESNNPQKTARNKHLPKGEATQTQPTPEQSAPEQAAPEQPAPEQLQPTNPPQIKNNPSESLDPASIVLLICEQKPQIPASSGQIIHLVVHKKENLDPVPGLTAKITVVTPNGEYVYVAPPTGSGGRASIAIAPMPDVENGSLITYQVCIDTGSGEPICEYDSYLIWNYQ